MEFGGAGGEGLQIFEDLNRTEGRSSRVTGSAHFEICQGNH